jgi:hypothetical protein
MVMSQPLSWIVLREVQNGNAGALKNDHELYSGLNVLV